jgi:hypothetical protein
LEPCQKGRKEELMWDPYAKTFPSSYERKVGIDDVIQEKDNIALALINLTCTFSNVYPITFFFFINTFDCLKIILIIPINFSYQSLYCIIIYIRRKHYLLFTCILYKNITNNYLYRGIYVIQ